MECISSELLLHRSKHRIKKLGEVFTPETCIEDMLSLIANGRKDFWCDEGIVFFEPCCGHGNIVARVLSKRLSAIYSKAITKKIANPAHYAVANAIHTLWAIDIDKKNVKECRSRVLNIAMSFLQEKYKLLNYKSVICLDKEFIAHLICSVKWHIHENETLSAISDKNIAHENAHKTIEGGKWHSKNDYQPLDFEKSWVLHFTQQTSKQSIPDDYKRAISCINKMNRNKSVADPYFDFLNLI